MPRLRDRCSIADDRLFVTLKLGRRGRTVTLRAFVNQDGNAVLKLDEGTLVVQPRYSNEIVVKAEP